LLREEVRDARKRKRLVVWLGTRYGMGER